MPGTSFKSGFCHIRNRFRQSLRIHGSLTETAPVIPPASFHSSAHDLRVLRIPEYPRRIESELSGYAESSFTGAIRKGEAGLLNESGYSL
ncbi:MAG: hypothetical protein LBE85_10705 [Candidatus Accumulibacter sp.]|jgi:hypothetical protein|nr:hypothetical protein [Accumulibacter sp.]